MTKDGEQTAQQTNQQTNQQTAQQTGTAQSEPASQPTFDYEKLAGILDGRQQVTEENVLKGYFKEQGMTEEEMAQAIKSFKDTRASKQPDITGMQAQIDELRQAMEAANTSARVAKVENAVIVEATKMGIDPKAIPYLTRMADLSNVGDATGAIDTNKVAEALGKVLDDLPTLKPQATQQQGFRVGGEGGKPEAAQQADDAKIKAIFGVK